MFVLSVTDGTDVHKSLLRRKPEVVVNVGSLEIMEKADVVRHTLARHGKALDETAFNNQVGLKVGKAIQ